MIFFVLKGLIFGHMPPLVFSHMKTHPSIFLIRFFKSYFDQLMVNWWFGHRVVWIFEIPEHESYLGFESGVTPIRGPQTTNLPSLILMASLESMQQIQFGFIPEFLADGTIRRSYEQKRAQTVV